MFLKFLEMWTNLQARIIAEEAHMLIEVLTPLQSNELQLQRILQRLQILRQHFCFLIFF